MIGELIAKYRGGVIAVLVVAVVYGGYHFFIKPSMTEEDLVTVSSPVAVAQTQGETLELLQTLRSIRLEATVFDNKIFQSLQDFSQPLRDEPRSRANPFAPVGGVSSTQSQ